MALELGIWLGVFEIVVGARVGLPVGGVDGPNVGMTVGEELGFFVGLVVGGMDGTFVGDVVGFIDNDDDWSRMEQRIQSGWNVFAASTPAPHEMYPLVGHPPPPTSQFTILAVEQFQRES